MNIVQILKAAMTRSITPLFAIGLVLALTVAQLLGAAPLAVLN